MVKTAHFMLCPFTMHTYKTHIANFAVLLVLNADSAVRGGPRGWKWGQETHDNSQLILVATRGHTWGVLSRHSGPG